MTSHDVVARARRVLSVRKVGHAGTLDPMATGLLILGVGAATRLLGYVGGHDKTYEATIRLGQSTVTDDREGEVLDDDVRRRHLDDDAIRAALAAQTGPLQQVPSSVSAVKVDGRRSYDRVRAGEAGRAGARARSPCTRSTCTGSPGPTPDLVDVDVTVDVHRRHLHPGHRPRRRRRARRRRAPDRAAPHRLGALHRRAGRPGRGGRRRAARRRRSGRRSGSTDAAATVFPARRADRRGGPVARSTASGSRPPAPRAARRRRSGRPAGRAGRGRRPDRPGHGRLPAPRCGRGNLAA